MKTIRKNIKGFTMAELILSIAIAGILFTTAVGVYSAFFGSLRNIRAANHIYEETNFLMERILKEIRLNTVDYDEYYNKFASKSPYASTEVYGLNTCSYNELFYEDGRDNIFGTEDDISTGKNIENTRAIASPTQDQLILINEAGNEKTIIKKIKEDSACDELNETCTYQVGMIKLDGFDYGIDGNAALTSGDKGQNDGHIDTWRCKTGFTCDVYDSGESVGEEVKDAVFVPISPKSIDVEELKFIIAPADNPIKAYNDPLVQIQPYVTVKIKAKAHPRLATEFKGGTMPDISIASTMTTRLHNEIHKNCFRPLPSVPILPNP